jgi:hypothetical protein
VCKSIELAEGNPLVFPNGNENGNFYEPLYLAKYTGDSYWTHGKSYEDAINKLKEKNSV